MNRPPAPTSALSLGEQSSHAKALFRNNLQGEDAYARHQRYVRDYARFYSSSSGSTVSDPAPNRRTDFDVLKAAHKFIRGEDEVNEADLEKLSYEEQLAVKYYASLFKEYAVCDLKHYKSGNVSQ